MATKKTRIILRILLVIVLLVIITGGTALYLYKSKATTITSDYYLRIGNDDNIASLALKLEKECGLKYPSVFIKVAERMNLQRWMKKGRYQLTPNMTITDVVRLFRSGRSQTVNLVVRGMTDVQQFAENCGNKLEPDTDAFLYLLNDTAYLDSMGFNLKTVFALPLPDTYNVFWHTEPDELMQRLKKEYDKYWNDNRKALALQCGLTPIEVSTLASIVCKETNQVDEMPIVAGMYLNRLRMGMPLQADPTIKFALNQPLLKRVLKIHLTVESPYNTYKYNGLPPGPICIPSKQAIEAVLHFTEHNYIFMCAREDFSGYHNFTVSYNEHLLNAKRYQAALDRRGIQ
ncbi:MAG: endolytic transglycosylase MltG [Bacteroidota bacterium]